MCVSVCVTVAAGHAQQITGSDFAPVVKTATGWWTPQRTATTVVAPYLQLNMSKLSRFEISEPLRSSTSQANNYSNVNQGGFELERDRPSRQISSLEEAALLTPRSFLFLMEAKYITWESSLADTRSLTTVNGVLVYPLAQVDYAQWHLPISLYIPSLRGSDTR